MGAKRNRFGTVRVARSAYNLVLTHVCRKMLAPLPNISRPTGCTCSNGLLFPPPAVDCCVRATRLILINVRELAESWSSYSRHAVSSFPPPLQFFHAPPFRIHGGSDSEVSPAMKRKRQSAPEVLTRAYGDHVRTFADAILSLLPLPQPQPPTCRCSGRGCLGCRGRPFLLRDGDDSEYLRLLTQGFAVVADHAPPISVFLPYRRWPHDKIVKRIVEMVMFESSEAANDVLYALWSSLFRESPFKMYALMGYCICLTGITFQGITLQNDVVVAMVVSKKMKIMAKGHWCNHGEVDSDALLFGDTRLSFAPVAFVFNVFEFLQICSKYFGDALIGDDLFVHLLRLVFVSDPYLSVKTMPLAFNIHMVFLPVMIGLARSFKQG
ncbi:hypothetical protein ACLOJK_031370 [Asimina triloba]